jgi:hypothetical protein
VTLLAGNRADRPPIAFSHVNAPGHAPYDEGVRPGTRVEVRSRFESRWTRGFEVADLVDESEPGTGAAMYRVRRRSDGSILPVNFAETDLREENRRSTWWI